jgi:hypothetical protein
MTEEKRPSMHDLIDQVIERMEQMVDEQALEATKTNKGCESDDKSSDRQAH